jgi:uncharacterized damage-inducible protein DinB
MTEETPRRLIVEITASQDPEIGRWVWALEDTRRETLRSLKGLDQLVLDWTPPRGGNSIATLLYHIAAIELDWLYAEVLQAPEPWPASVTALFPENVRDDQSQLSEIRGEPLADLVCRLDVVRSSLLEAFRDMTLQEFRRARSLPDYDVTPEWVLHHLMQHEAEHRGHIQLQRTWAVQALGASEEGRSKVWP